MSNKKTRELTLEEKLEKEKQHGLREIQDTIHHLNEPTYFFNIGDQVQCGFLKESIVDEILYDGKAYGLKCTATNNNYGKPYDYQTYRIVPWMNVRPLDKGSTNFAKNQDIKLFFSNSTIDSLIFKYYRFGIDMDPSYQRGYVWKQEDKELLIDSIFNNIDIGKFVLIEKDDWLTGDFNFEILDGKQRLSTLIEFYENRFKYNGKYFNELSAKDQLVFKSHHISVAEIENCTKQEILQHFLMLNRTGRAMSREHLNKVEEILNDLKEE